MRESADDLNKSWSELREAASRRMLDGVDNARLEGR